MIIKENNTISAEQAEIQKNAILQIRAENDRFAGPRNKKPMLDVDYVVGKAMKSMRRGKILCTCNWYTKMQHLFSKILPNRMMIAMWQGMCKK